MTLSILLDPIPLPSPTTSIGGGLDTSSSDSAVLTSIFVTLVSSISTEFPTGPISTLAPAGPAPGTALLPTTSPSTTAAASNLSTPTSNAGASSSPSAAMTTPTSLVATTLSVASTIVGESTALATSGDGSVYTTTAAFTTTLAPGSVVTVPVDTATRSSSTNVGAIVGGVVGGVGGLFILALLLFFCLCRRRKNEFDRNFDPAHVTSVEGGGGGTLRLGASAGGGGIVTPFAFVPSAPLGGSGAGGAHHQYSSPHMQQIGGAADGVGAAAVAGAAGYGNVKRAMRQQQYGHTPNPSVSLGSHYPATMASSANPQYQQLNANGVGSPEPSSPTSDGFTSVGGRSSNPDDGPVPGSGGGQLPGFQQAYLQSGPGPHHQQQPNLSSSSSTPVPGHQQQHSPMPSSAGTAVVVHEDGGRVVFRKREGEGEGEVLNSELPPTYDSLPVDVRRDS